jgi:hypothetical protein
MKKFKFAVGVVCLLIMGFIAYTLVTGFGILVALIFIVFPLWQIILGTVVGAVCILLHLWKK